MHKKAIIAGGAAILLGGILFIVFSSNDELAQVIQEVELQMEEERQTNALTSAQTDEENPGSIEAPRATQNRVLVEEVPATNQVVLGETEAGNIITVARAVLLEDGYIVLYRINSNGDASFVGKSDLLQPGTHTNIAIQVTPLIVKRQGIVAVLHGDDGDGKFAYPGPDRYLLNNGLMASDIDVVGVDRADRESKILETQVRAYLKTNFE